MNYINNNDLYCELCCYIYRVRQWEAAGKGPGRPYLSEYPEIVSALLKIVDGLARKPCFSGYSYVEDMKQDALLTAIMYMERFNPDRSKNAFSYLTTITHNAFLKRIAREKRQAWWKIATKRAACGSSIQKPKAA